MKYCYHTHTKRCGHAVGEDEEYVIEAIKAGIKDLGFSDHVFLKGITQQGIRGDYSCLDDYISSINNLKEKYKKDINIYVGFEAEYFPPYIDYYKELIESNKIDYLILGQHFDWTKDNKIGTSFFDCHTRNEINKYLETVTKAMESGLFSIFAHPDICFVGYENEWDEYCEEIAYKICEVAIKNDVFLEINLCGIRRGFGFKNHDRYQYPYYKFWEVVAKTNAKVLIGCDAHDPLHFHDKGYQEALDFIEKYNIKVIDDGSASNVLKKYKKMR